MRTLLLVLVVIGMTACSILEKTSAMNRCHLGWDFSWSPLTAPPTQATELRQLTASDNYRLAFESDELWLSHPEGRLLLCRGDKRDGDKWQFEHLHDQWVVVDREQWVTAT